MNILIIGKFYVEGFALHIAETLNDMGHTVGRFEPGHKAHRITGPIGRRLDQILGVLHNNSDQLPVIRAHRMRALWRMVEESRWDIVLVCSDFLWPKEVEELKRRSRAQVTMWFPDPLSNFQRALFMQAPYDALFFKDPFIVQRMGDVLASPVYYLPEAFNPQRHVMPAGVDPDDPVYRCDIATAGNLHAWRVAVYKHLVDYNVKLWGHLPPLWMPAGPVLGMYQGRGVYNAEKARAFRGARIVVNNLIFGEIWGVNVRCFEAAGVGAFQMLDWRPGLHHLFEDGKELITFNNMTDLKAKIDYWLPREDERRVIAEAGQRRAYSEHTYRHRLDILLATLAGEARGFPVPVISLSDSLPLR